jgi:ethanolamine utilization microcompartment shell protein EutL
MATVTPEILQGVKNALNVTGTFQDETISGYIVEVMDYMAGAGVSDAMISASVGTIARGVSDLWDNDGGNVRLSQYFMHRVAQLVYRSTNGGGT